MTSDEIDAIYTELTTLHVQIEDRPEKGLAYMKERLTLCRAMADRVSELRLKVNRALTEIIHEHLVAQQTHELTPTTVSKARIRELDVSKQKHALLAKMVTLQGQLLSRTAQDIRLLTDITKELIKSGPVDPNEVPGLVQDTPITDLIGSKPTATDGLGHVFEAPAATSPAFVPTGRSAPLESDLSVDAHKVTGVTTVGFDSPAAAPPEDRLKLPENQTVSFEDLFTPKETVDGTAGVL